MVPFSSGALIRRSEYRQERAFFKIQSTLPRSGSLYLQNRRDLCSALNSLVQPVLRNRPHCPRPTAALHAQILITNWSPSACNCAQLPGAHRASLRTRRGGADLSPEAVKGRLRASALNFHRACGADLFLPGVTDRSAPPAADGSPTGARKGADSPKLSAFCARGISRGVVQRASRRNGDWVLFYRPACVLFLRRGCYWGAR